jgi:hypothetical protein
METDPAIGMEADPREQRRSEDEQVQEAEQTQDDGQRAEGAASDSEEEVDDPYDPDARKSVVVPGTDGTLSGTAFADMVDGDGNLKDDANQQSPEELEKVKQEYDEAKKEFDERQKQVENQADDDDQAGDNQAGLSSSQTGS